MLFRSNFTMEVPVSSLCNNSKSLLEVESGKLDDDTHSDTCLDGKGFIIINTHD